MSIQSTLEGQQYSSAEQFYQSKKAEFAGNKKTGVKIMSTIAPHVAACMGKSLQMPHQKREEWMTTADPTLMKKAMIAKFEQDPVSRKTLQPAD